MLPLVPPTFLAIYNQRKKDKEIVAEKHLTTVEYGVSSKERRRNYDEIKDGIKVECRFTQRSHYKG